MRGFLSLLLSTTLITGCQTKSGNTIAGNPLVSVSLTGSSQAATVAKNIWEKLFNFAVPRAVAYPAPTGMVDAAGNNVTITYLWQTIRNIEFKYDETASGGESSEVSFAGPYTIDALSAAPTSFASGNISRAQMRRIKIQLARTTTLPSGAPAGLNNSSIYIAGTVGGVSFTYNTPDETEFEIGGPNLLTVTDNNKLLVQINTANVIKRINLSAITSSTTINDSNRVNATNPCPNVDASATDLYTCFRKAIQSEANFGKDSDGDYHLGSGDDAVK